MPSGKVHDAVTVLLAIPVAAVCYQAAAESGPVLLVTGTFLFGGFMFGPDLDTNSKQFSRWTVFRWLWLPYRTFFKHRSRFSHGLLLGALIRVIYFLGALTVGAFIVLYAYAAYTSGAIPSFMELSGEWRSVGEFLGRAFGEYFLPLSFLGLWLGAASHTFTDMAGSFIKTGRVAKFL